MDAGMEGLFDFGMGGGGGSDPEPGADPGAERGVNLDLDLGAGTDATSGGTGAGRLDGELRVRRRGSGVFSAVSGLSPAPSAPTAPAQTRTPTQTQTHATSSGRTAGTPLTAMYCIVRNGECGLCRDLVGLTSRVWDDATVGMLEKIAASLEEWEAGWMGRKVRVRGEDGFVER